MSTLCSSIIIVHPIRGFHNYSAAVSCGWSEDSRYRNDNFYGFSLMASMYFPYFMDYSCYGLLSYSVMDYLVG